MTRCFCDSCGKEIKPSKKGYKSKLTFKFADMDEHFCSLDCLRNGLAKWFKPICPEKVTIDYEWSLAEDDWYKEEE